MIWLNTSSSGEHWTLGAESTWDNAWVKFTSTDQRILLSQPTYLNHDMHLSLPWRSLFHFEKHSILWNSVSSPRKSFHGNCVMLTLKVGKVMHYSRL